MQLQLIKNENSSPFCVNLFSVPGLEGERQLLAQLEPAKDAPGKYEGKALVTGLAVAYTVPANLHGKGLAIDLSLDHPNLREGQTIVVKGMLPTAMSGPVMREVTLNYLKAVEALARIALDRDWTLTPPQEWVTMGKSEGEIDES